MRITAPATVAVLSDTHGPLPLEVAAALEGIAPDLIVHAGDVGGDSVLLELESIAPLLAVRGNTDHGPWSLRLADTTMLRVGDMRVLLVHDAGGLKPPPGTDIVISGHTHLPRIERRGGVMWVNPGSVSRPRGAERVPTFAVLEFDQGLPAARIVHV